MEDKSTVRDGRKIERFEQECRGKRISVVPVERKYSLNSSRGTIDRYVRRFVERTSEADVVDLPKGAPVTPESNRRRSRFC